MFVELNDIQSDRIVKVTGPGIIMGREGADNDLPVPGRTVSSKHARIFPQDGRWFLEDLNSSNGTFVAGKRIRQPVELQVGLNFALCRYAFEVVHLELEQEDTTSPQKAPPPPKKVPLADTRVRKPEDGREGDLQPLGEGEDDSATEPGEMVGMGQGASVDSPSARNVDRDEGVQEGEGLPSFLLSATPNAVGVIIVESLKLLFRPIAAIRASVREQRYQAMDAYELIAYAMAAQGIVVLLSQTSGLITAAISGAFSFSLILAPLVATLVAILAGLATGYFFHPVVDWLVTLLKGRSNERERSNYFMLVMSAMPLLTLPAVVGALIGLLGVPVLSIVPLLMSLVATLVMASASYVWFRYFAVMPWVPLLFVLLGVAACSSTGFALVQQVRAQLQIMTSSTDEMPDEKQASALPNENTPESKKPESVLKEKQTQPEENSEQAVQPKEESVSNEVPEEESGADTSAVGKNADDPAQEAESTDGSGGYQSFIRKRAVIEQRIDNDPTLLRRKEVLSLYRKLHELTIKAEQTHVVKVGRKATPEKLAEAKVAEKLKEAESYELTQEVVEQLFQILNAIQPR